MRNGNFLLVALLLPVSPVVKYFSPLAEAISEIGINDAAVTSASDVN